MDFSWSETEQKMRQSAVLFAQKELSEGIVERDRDESFSHDQWKACAQYGILGLSFPEEFGGTETDILTTMLTMEGLGYGGKDNGLIFSLNAQMWSVQHPLNQYGTLAQKQKYLPGLIKGDLIAAHGMTEPEAGSDAYSLRTRAQAMRGLCADRAQDLYHQRASGRYRAHLCHHRSSQGQLGDQCLYCGKGNVGI